MAVSPEDPVPFLDFGYQLPDCVWAQPAEQRSPRNSPDFAEVGERRFIRGLLPIRLPDGREFRYGVWLEIDEATFIEVNRSWGDPERYPRLRFGATIANAAPPWRDQLLGVAVEVGVRDQDSRPFVIASSQSWLQDLLDHGWTMTEYRAAIDAIGVG
jgi:hypothetical protein